jgi:hypothetical protein
MIGLEVGAGATEIEEIEMVYCELERGSDCEMTAPFLSTWKENW